MSPLLLLVIFITVFVKVNSFCEYDFFVFTDQSSNLARDGRSSPLPGTIEKGNLASCYFKCYFKSVATKEGIYLQDKISRRYLRIVRATSASMR